MITEALDFRFLLLENYKKLKISEIELATILVMDHLINEGNRFVTADLLALKMTLDIKEIDKVLAALLKKGYLEYKTSGKKTISSLNPLKEKLYNDFQVSLTKETATNKNEEKKNQLSNIYVEFENLLGRTLSPVEVSKIREWISNGYSDEIIINALKESLASGKKTIRNVDKILLTWSTREEREQEGHSSLNDDWDKNLEETIRIAKTPWIKKNND